MSFLEPQCDCSQYDRHKPAGNHIYDKVVTARIDLTKFRNIKLEGHFMDGYGFPIIPMAFILREPTWIQAQYSWPCTKDEFLFLIKRAPNRQNTMNKPQFLLLGAIGFVVLSTLGAFAGDVKVIANPNITANTISRRELKDVFLEDRSSIGGDHVEAVLETGGTVHETFLRKYLGRGDNDLHRYYLALVFSGRGSVPKVN